MFVSLLPSFLSSKTDSKRYGMIDERDGSVFGDLDRFINATRNITVKVVTMAYILLPLLAVVIIFTRSPTMWYCSETIRAERDSATAVSILRQSSIPGTHIHGLYTHIPDTFTISTLTSSSTLHTTDTCLKPSNKSAVVGEAISPWQFDSPNKNPTNTPQSYHFLVP
ncbi:hypothetical protein BT96DRAFT_1007453 [Gymnopus androsaceus JB14]|uniref:Uncharacterized protein n=1 Tax=Gymnopus androsaceus JB14 TaxID=1447944 RepID=A0A6A4GID7_9AGAR|nr:hypothetical protein BT96DRAFT_1007453 [Gymnopus androsaceus JB14]